MRKINAMNLKSIKEEVLSQLPGEEVAHGEILFNNCECQILSQSAVSIDFLITTAEKNEYVEYALIISAEQGGDVSLTPQCGNKPAEWDRYSYACLLQYEQELSLLDPKEVIASFKS